MISFDSPVRNGHQENRREVMSNLGFHPMTEDFRVMPWACEDPGPLAVREAHTVMQQHKEHAGNRRCIIRRTAIRTLVDAKHMVRSSQHAIGSTLLEDTE